jgi:ubiquinone/menaquinone biosynthesis C-methylase UbiE
LSSDYTKDIFKQQRVNHWDQIARKTDSWTSWGIYYRRRLIDLYKSMIPEGKTILEVGSGKGELLAALKPERGIGIDFSKEMIKRARNKFPDLIFIEADAHEININEKFDYIIFSDLINDLWDVQTVFEELLSLVTPRTRIILNFYSRLWEPILNIAKFFGVSTPVLSQNWFALEDVANILFLSDFEIIKHQTEILYPLPPAFLANFFNRFLVKFWPFKFFALTNVVVARPKPQPVKFIKKPLVSVIIPARNEEGNIPEIINRVPEMGGGTEIVFVEGHSRDDTYDVIRSHIETHPKGKYKLFKQMGDGKGDAVRLGFAEASGEILMILDADLTVPPEDLLRFYEALISGKGDLINGVRLVYPLEDKAMRFFNFLGNKFFSYTFSWLLGQQIKDTLCGTKVLWRRDYAHIEKNRSYFGDFDPFGDFDLIFNAAHLGMKIIDIPVRYRERVYGETNISRWRHGWLLLKMAAIAAKKIKFT